MHKDSKKMGKRTLLLLLATLLVVEAIGQRRPIRGMRAQEWIVERGDSIAHVEVLPVYVFSRPIDLRP